MLGLVRSQLSSAFVGLLMLSLTACTARLITPPPSTAVTLTGVIQLAPVKNEKVQAFKLAADGSLGSSPVAEGTSGEDGTFSLVVPAAGLYVIKTEGVGKHLDEASKVEQDAVALSAVVDTKQQMEVPITPVSTLHQERALELIKNGGKNPEQAMELAATEVAPKFNLDGNDLSEAPVSPYGVAALSIPERVSKARRIKVAERLATFSYFIQSFSLQGLDNDEKLDKLMAALRADFKDDGLLNGSITGDLRLIALKAALTWASGMTTAKESVLLDDAMAFDDVQSDIAVVASSVAPGEEAFNPGVTLTGLFLDKYYVNSQLAQLSDGAIGDLYYSDGEIAHGFMESECYVNGLPTLSNGSGACLANNKYYVSGQLAQGLIGGKYYSDGQETCNGVCANEGEACNKTDTFCAPGLTCAGDHKCHLASGVGSEGASCSNSDNSQCANGYYCSGNNTCQNCAVPSGIQVAGINGFSVAISPDGSKAYVVHLYSGDVVSVIDTFSNSLIATIPVGSNPSDIAVVPDGSKAYVANRESNSVSVINTANNLVVGTVPVGQFPNAIAITPDGSKAYVANFFGHTISVINTANDTVIGTVSDLSSPFSIAITPDGSKAYIASLGGTVFVLNTSDNTVTGTVTVGTGPYAVAITPDGSKAYVLNNGFNVSTVSVIQTSNDTVIATILDIGLNAQQIAITPDGSKALVTIANGSESALTVIATSNNGITGRILNFSSPMGIAITPDGSKAYVGNYMSILSVIDIASQTHFITTTAPVCEGNFAGACTSNSNCQNGYRCGDTGFCIVAETSCADNIDNDGDGNSDCSDFDCRGISGCMFSGAEGSTYYVSNEATTLDWTGTGEWNGVYYMIGQATTLNGSGNGTWNGTCYSFGWDTGELVNGNGYCSGDGIYYASGISASGFYNNTCYSNGIDTGEVVNGHGNCSGDGIYYAGGVPANGLYNGVCYEAGSNTGEVNPRFYNPVAVAITPDGTKAYVANRWGSNSVSVINTSTNTVTGSIPVGAGPTSIAITPDGTKAYVGNHDSHSVSVISVSTNTVTATISGVLTPSPIAITPDGTMAYVGKYWGAGISVINTSTDTVITSIPVGANPHHVAVTPDGAKAYVANQSNQTISVIDTATNAVTATFSVGSSPIFIAFTPDGAKAYVALYESSSLSVVDTSTNTVIGSIPVGAHHGHVTFTPDGAKAYVALGGSSSLSVIDTLTNTVIASIPVGATPNHIAITPDGAKAYVANFNSNSISVIDTASNTVVNTLVGGTGLCSGDGSYYVDGSPGTGFYNGIYYASGSPAQGFYDGTYYASGSPGNGFYNGTCYSNGADTSEVSNGDGYCSGDGIYYAGGSPAYGVYNGVHYFRGSPACEYTGLVNYGLGSFVGGLNNYHAFKNFKFFDHSVSLSEPEFQDILASQTETIGALDTNALCGLTSSFVCGPGNNCSEKYVVNNTTPQSNSRINYERTTMPSSFSAQFDLKAWGGNGADGIFFYWQAKGSTNSCDLPWGKGVNVNQDGYVVTFDEFLGNNIYLFWAGNYLTSASTGVDLDDGVWRTAEIVVTDEDPGKNIKVYLNGSLKIDFTDTVERNLVSACSP